MNDTFCKAVALFSTVSFASLPAFVSAAGLDLAVNQVMRPDEKESVEGDKNAPDAASVSSARLRLQSDTIIRVFERDTVNENDVTAVPIYEYLRIDYGAPEGGGLSFHGYGWGRADVGERDFFEDETEGELLYGYLEYAHPTSNFDIRLGRQFIFSGITNEGVDGLRLQSDLTSYFSIKAFGGLPVSLDRTAGRNDDSIYGGRISHHLRSLYDLGVSYKQVISESRGDDERLGVDFFLGLPGGVSLTGISNLNLETHDWGEHSYEARVTFLDIDLRPYFQRFQYEDFFPTKDNSANPFRFLAGTEEVLTVYGGDVVWHGLSRLDLGAKIKHYDYDLRDDSALYYSALATWHGEVLTQIGAELGNMEGDTAENDYWLARAYFYIDNLPAGGNKGFLTGDVVYARYDEEIFNEDDSQFVSLGYGLKFLDGALELKLSGDYTSGPFFDDDYRGTLVVTYTFE